MKVLTIKEPWASLIINGYKKYEFRSWKTNYRGKILIHAGKSIEKDMLIKFKNYNIECYKGAIIGEAFLTDCILVDDDFENKLLEIDPIVYGRENHEMKYAFKLENIVKYENPIYINGKLGLWNYERNDNMQNMRLNEEPFRKIKSGSKTIEIRLNDEKRSKLQIGDIIEFENRMSKEKIQVKVINLHFFKSFEDLYKKFDKVSLGYDEDDAAKASDMRKYYSKSDEEKYGVVGIEIMLL